MYLKLVIAFCAIGLSLYGQQAESMSPPPDAAAYTQADIPALKPMEGVYIDWKDRVIHAVGKGQASADAEAAPAQLALRAAQADALRKLAAVVYGLHVDPVTTVELSLSPKDDAHRTLRVRVEGLIRGAQEFSEPSCEADGWCQVHLILPLERLEKVLNSAPFPRQ